MRTTIEISAEHRARLMELAARRGQKGFSRLVQEALDACLRSQSREDVLIDFLRGRGRTAERVALELDHAQLCTIAVTRFELRVGARSARLRRSVCRRRCDRGSVSRAADGGERPSTLKR